jgi:hypothetical protein
VLLNMYSWILLCLSWYKLACSLMMMQMMFGLALLFLYIMACPPVFVCLHVDGLSLLTVQQTHQCFDLTYVYTRRSCLQVPQSVHCVPLGHTQTSEVHARSRHHIVYLSAEKIVYEDCFLGIFAKHEAIQRNDRTGFKSFITAASAGRKCAECQSGILGNTKNSSHLVSPLQPEIEPFKY